MKPAALLMMVVAVLTAPPRNAERALPRVMLGAEGNTVVRGTLHLTADRVYELAHDLDVQSGDLVLDAGTRVEAAPGTSIVVSRGGRIIAEGTVTRPVVLTCRGAGGPGCWGGLVINGNATLNLGTPTSPMITGRTSSAGCLEVTAQGNGSYGGCEDADSSGVLRYVWIERAGGVGKTGLALRGVGNHTVVQNVQVYASAGTGINVRGGTVDLRYFRVAAADSIGLRWTLGWRGRAQFGIVQAKSGAQAAVNGSNLDSSPDAQPRSAPQIRNVTIVGPPAQDTASGAASLHFSGGTGGRLEAFLVLHQPATRNWALDIDGGDTWTQALNGGLVIAKSYFVGFAPLGDLDDDEVMLAASMLYSPDAESQYLQQSANANRIVVAFDSINNQLKAAFGPMPDLRPNPSGPQIISNCILPTTDPFFQDVPYCGALSNDGFAGLIPWNEPGSGRPLPVVNGSSQYGHLVVRVVSNFGPMAGVQIRAGSFVTSTDAFGFANFYLKSGFTGYSLMDLPIGCADPGLFIINIPVENSIGQLAVVQCN